MEPFRSKLSLDVSSSCIPQYLCAILGVCLCVAGHPLHADSGKHQAPLSLLMYSGQPGVAGSNVVYTHM